MFQKKHFDLKCDLKFEISAQAKITITIAMYYLQIPWHDMKLKLTFRILFLQTKLVNGFGNLSTPRGLF